MIPIRGDDVHSQIESGENKRTYAFTGSRTSDGLELVP